MELWHLLVLSLFFLLVMFAAIYEDEKWMVAIMAFCCGWTSLLVMLGYASGA